MPSSHCFGSRFSYGFPIVWVPLPLLLPLRSFPVSVPDISPVEAASLHTFPYNSNFFCRLWRLRMPSRHDEKGGDGMSISASSVTGDCTGADGWSVRAEA